MRSALIRRDRANDDQESLNVLHQQGKIRFVESFS